MIAAAIAAQPKFAAALAKLELVREENNIRVYRKSVRMYWAVYLNHQGDAVYTDGRSAEVAFGEAAARTAP